MIRYGLFNDERKADGKAAFFAIQAAVSSYPGDPLREELRGIVGQITSSADREQQGQQAQKAMDLLIGAMPYIHYCSWDYTTMSKVAQREFASWVDEIQNAAGTAEDPEDVSGFVPDDTSYFVATFAVLSSQDALCRWLDAYPASLQESQYFERKTIESLLRRFSLENTRLLAGCVNAMFTLMPVATDHFYLGRHLRSQGWEYLRPVY